MKKIIMIVICLISLANSYAQNNTVYTIDLEKTHSYVMEIFQDCQEAMPNSLEKYKLMLAKIEIILSTEKEENLSNLPLFSTVRLKNKCNLSMSHDSEAFSVDTFNPLKYFFHYYEKNDLYYRVDNTNYIIKIKSN